MYLHNHQGRKEIHLASRLESKAQNQRGQIQKKRDLIIQPNYLIKLEMLNSKVLKLELEVFDLKNKMKVELGYDSDLVID